MALNQPANDVQAFGDKKFSARGEIARAKLKRAAMTVMEKTGYHRMRINDVTSEAGVAAGLFYHYFNDLKSLTLEVLKDYKKRLGIWISLRKMWHVVTGMPECMHISA